MSGKSIAAYEYIVALCKHDKTKRIGIATEYSYNILKARGMSAKAYPFLVELVKVPEECLIKCWEQEEREATLWFDEFPFDGGF